MKRDTRKARDTWIALRCKLGEPAGFQALVDEMERPLCYYVTKLTGDPDTALDVLQEVWVKVFGAIGRLEAPGALRTWVYRIARGTALNRVRSEVTRRRAEHAAAEEMGPDGGEDPRFDNEDVAALHEALDGLDAKHRDVLVLHFLEDLSIDEIAAVVGTPAGTVKSRIHHAKRALKGQLERKDHGTQE
jgi:RNA polymerase sigma-70 factor (ECF subfamily)